MGPGKTVRRWNYFFKLLTAFFIVSILPLAAVGIGFYASSSRIVMNASGQRGQDAAAVAVMTIEKHLNIFRHMAYSVSKHPVLSTVCSSSPDPDSSLKDIYKILYQELSGYIYSASIHIVSFDGRTVYSTHTLPSQYDLSDYSNYEGIFSENRPDKEQTYFYLKPFVSEQGERILGCFLREIDGGYVIVDVLAGPLVEAAEQPVFNSMILADRQYLQAFDFLRPERDGTFDHFEELVYLKDFDKEMMDGHYPLIRENRIIVSGRIPGSSLVFLGSVAADQYRMALNSLWKFGSGVFLSVIVLIIFLAFLFSRSIGRPIHSLASAMKYLSDGIPPLVPETQRNDELGYLVSSYNTMVKKLAELMERIREEERALRLAEHKALQAQLNPHFLYNTLGTIKSMAKLKGIPEIAEITSDLAKILKSVIRESESIETLSAGIEFLKNYVNIQSYRFGNRLNVSFDIPEDLEDVLIPRLILQPLVENAVVHGLEKSAKPVTITIRARRSTEEIQIEVIDDGPGFDTSTLENTSEAHIGIINVRRRMELHYPGRGKVLIESSVGSGTRAALCFPGEKQCIPL